MKKILLAFLLLPAGSALHAQSPAEEEETKYEIACYVYNEFTREGVEGCKVELLRPDSTLISEGSYWDKGRVNGRVQSIASFYTTTNEPADYLLRVSKEGYKTAYQRIHVRFTRGKKSFLAPNIYMKKLQPAKTHELGEAVVKATKIKMVMRGDTVVYNADAFRLAQGSMLDALIERLPGVKLDDSGVITVNGRRVESLLVNGRDFFRGDPSVALDNLPSYMVDKVKVYEKTSAYDRFLGLETAMKPLVMDVNLKKEYSVGWVANAEAAYGTEERYLGRLFALGFTPTTHTAIYGSMNNTNDTRRPGRTGQWTPAALPNGLQAAKTAGAEFSYQDKLGMKGWTSDVEFTHTDNDTRTRTNRQTFLPGGNTYGLAESASDNCATNVKTRHSFFFEKGGKLYTLGNFGFNYDRNSYTSTSRSGTWNDDPWTMSREGLLDSLFASPDASNLLRSLAVNRLRQDYLSRGKGWDADVADFLLSLSPFKYVGDNIDLGGSFRYTHRESETFSHYQLDYPATPTAAADLRNRYQNSPTDSYRYSAFAKYGAYLYVARFSLKYEFSQKYSSGGNDLFRLDRLAGWEPGGSNGLGLLPSTAEMETAKDFDNSAWRRQWEKGHTMTLSVHKSLTSKRGHYMEAELNLPVMLRHDHISYRRGSEANPTRHLTADERRSNVLFQPDFNVIHRFTTGKGRKFQFRYLGVHVQTPADQLYLLDYMDDSNPLNIRVGNPGLKDTRRTDLGFYMNMGKDGEARGFNFNTNYRLTTNAVAMGRTYNPTTGAYTTRPENVNGNWLVWGGLGGNFLFGKQKRFSFDSETNYTYHNSVDLTGVEGSAAPMRSTVRNLHLGETLRLEYSREKWRAGIKAHANWTHATSARQGFETVDAVDYHFAFTGRIELPGGVGFDTDLTLYSRRGYEDRTLNTDDLVWNARLTKSILGGSMTFIVDGFDILGQLSGVTRSLNAQGRTETFRNVLPSYFMAHVVYHLNIKPKKDRN